MVTGNLSSVAIRHGQDQPDEYGKLVGQEIKRGVAHNTPTCYLIRDWESWSFPLGLDPRDRRFKSFIPDQYYKKNLNDRENINPTSG